MSRHSKKEIERIKRLASKMTVGTGKAKAHSLNRIVGQTYVFMREGHDWHFAHDGRAAVQAAQAQDYDLVLMDLHMPEMDGIDATREPPLERWRTINDRVRNPEGAVTIAVVGKYTGMKDAYKSLIEALSLPRNEARQRMAILLMMVRRHDVHEWAREFLDVLTRGAWR